MPMVLLLLATLLWGSLFSWAGAAEPALGAESQEKVVLKWLGNAGWEIQLGKTAILIDPFLTRKDRFMDAEWKTDEEAVLKVIKGADYIFAGHSHHDHIGDVPFPEGLPESNRKRAQRFQRDIAAADDRIKVIVPDFFMTYTLE